MQELGYHSSIVDQSLHLVEMAYAVGARHFVCSPHEVTLLKTKFSDIVLYVPGVQVGQITNDQERVGTPQQVFEDGGDFVIMGRAISQTENPLDTVKKILL